MGTIIESLNNQDSKELDPRKQSSKINYKKSIGKFILSTLVRLPLVSKVDRCDPGYEVWKVQHNLYFTQTKKRRIIGKLRNEKDKQEGREDLQVPEGR